jgi:hypothetical protein
MLTTQAHGNVKTALLYQLGVVGGALSFVALGGGQGSLVGCSGGVYCLLGAHASELAVRTEEGHANRCCRGLLLACVAAADAYLSTAKSDGGASSAWQAHAGGFAVGLIGGGLLLETLSPEPPGLSRRPWCCFRRRVVAPLAALLLSFFFVAAAWATYRTARTFPPTGYFAGLEPASDSCCAQLLACDGLGAADYATFACGDEYDVTTATGRVLKTCAEMEDYAIAH